MSRQQKFAASALLVLTALLIPLRGISAEEVLTNASDILALSPERAGALGLAKISLTGVVTTAEPENWRGRYFYPGSPSGGVFVNNAWMRKLPGSRRFGHGDWGHHGGRICAVH